jgi:endonuclease/exonuclease/phosphatase family metal-dependent hydrolase
VDSYARTTDKVNADWPSYNGYKYISTPPAKASRIDHIFVTKGRTKVQSWAIVNTSYSQKYPSDHFPVVIEWSFAK